MAEPAGLCAVTQCIDTMQRDFEDRECAFRETGNTEFMRIFELQNPEVFRDERSELSVRKRWREVEASGMRFRISHFLKVESMQAETACVIFLGVPVHLRRSWMSRERDCAPPMSAIVHFHHRHTALLRS
jgi:hypothetical protein